MDPNSASPSARLVEQHAPRPCQVGIDQPIHIQYVRWLGDILLRGTLGDTLLGKDTVEAKIWRRAGPTFQLALMALNIAMVIALPVGIFSAIRQDTAGDVRTAWAKGLRERMVVLRHAIKNAMIPVLSANGLAVPLLVGGSVIIETDLPGMGHLVLVALEDRDYRGGQHVLGRSGKRRVGQERRRDLHTATAVAAGPAGGKGVIWLSVVGGTTSPHLRLRIRDWRFRSEL